MPLINQALPNLIGGVSQQPDVTRFDGQCEEQENALSSVVDGLSKRPQTKHVAELMTSAIANNSFVHFINRTEGEKYVVVIDSSTNKLHAYNLLTGIEATIDGTTGGKNISNTDYLFSSTYSTSLKALSIGDSTFILNTEQSVAPTDITTTAGKTPSLEKEAAVFIKQGDYKKKYGVTLRGNFSNTGNTSAAISVVCGFVNNRKSNDFYRVKSVSLINNNGGSGYAPNEINAYITTSAIATGLANAGTSMDANTIYTQPTFNFTLSSTDGSVTAVTVANAGKFCRSGDGIATTKPDINVVLTVSAPTGQALYATDDTNADDAITASITSEASTGAEGDETDTQNIAARLLNNSGESNDLSDNGITSTTGANVEFSAVRKDSLIMLTREADGSDFDITAFDGLANTGIGALYKETDTISDLPAYNKNGFRIKIKGDAESNSDDYYVKFSTKNNSSFGVGTYEEDVAPDIAVGIDKTTMPKILVNSAENTFVFGDMEVANRIVGDDNTNPMPSFVGQSLSNIFFFKNRLGFISNDNIVMTEAGLGLFENGVLKYNFFRTTVTTSLDSDPIDVTVSSPRVTNLRYAMGFQENLIIFADQAQFVLKGGDLLTPSTVSITPITNFESDDAVSPLPLGSYLYFPFSRGEFTGIREFTVNSTTDNYDATEITEHIPTYIPQGVTKLIGSSSEDTIVAQTTTAASTLYIYKYFWSGQKKLLSSWSKFIFPFEIQGADIFEGTLYIVATKESKTHLLSMPLQSGLKDTGMNYNTHLDMRKEHTLTNATAEASTVVPLGFTASVGDRVQVWDDEGTLLHDQTLTGTATSVTLGTPHIGKVFSGLVYTMKYVFSEQVFKQPTGNSKAPSGFTRAQIRNGAVFFNDTRGFKVKVQPDNRDETTHTFTPTFIGTSSIGNIELQNGNFRFPVFTDALGTTITIENDSALPANFSSAEFEMFVHERSKRFG